MGANIKPSALEEAVKQKLLLEQTWVCLTSASGSGEGIRWSEAMSAAAASPLCASPGSSIALEVIVSSMARLTALRLRLFGCGSVAQTVLSKGALGGPLTIHIGFTLGVMMAVFMAGGVSGAHVNPAVSLAMVLLGRLPLRKFPVYVLAQFLGAFAGSCVVYALYYDALMDYTNGDLMVTGENATANIFASYPAKHLSTLNGFVDQVIATASLILCILAITDGKNIGAPKGMEPLCIGLIIMAIGVSMGFNCGYPINPARDLGPRFFTAVAGWGMDVFRAGGCWWWIPVAGPMVGGVVGASVYFLLVELHHTEPKTLEVNNVKDKYEMITVS